MFGLGRNTENSLFCSPLVTKQNNRQWSIMQVKNQSKKPHEPSIQNWKQNQLCQAFMHWLIDIELGMRNIPSTLIEDLVSAIYRFSGESVESGEYAMTWFAREISRVHHTSVILPDRFVQENSRPFSGPELCFSDELNSAGLDSVHEHAHSDYEWIRV